MNFFWKFFFEMIVFSTREKPETSTSVFVTVSRTPRQEPIVDSTLRESTQITSPITVEDFTEDPGPSGKRRWKDGYGQIRLTKVSRVILDALSVMSVVSFCRKGENFFFFFSLYLSIKIPPDFLG